MFWTPERRPDGRNLALTIDPPLRAWPVESLRTGHARPTDRPNAWAAAPHDPRPALHLRWPEPRRISRVHLAFDTDHDHAMESVLGDHTERAVPFCVRDYTRRASGHVIAERRDNHQTRNVIVLDEPVTTDDLSLEIPAPHGDVPASVFEVRCYG
ncbi:hypothetical protein [Streptomyces sp. NRRL F-5123]|uniref:hypothetical protein n=1 Tax=Streptomyces sp. NRRL F-5123 TaxID=1463856 RepID=UPI0004E0B2EE|nr:hypothetical protein [Streptomyces sp. NRRL F-5123]